MMNVIDLFLFIFAVYSLTFAFIHSPLLLPIKMFIKNKLPERLKSGVDCFHCIGFQMSIIILVFVFNIFSVKMLFLYSLVGAAFSMIIHIFLHKISSKEE